MTTAPVEYAVDYTALATSIIRSITGGRWTWPPVEVRDIYRVPAGIRVVQLRGEPLIDVIYVQDYATGADLEYTNMGNSRLELSRACRSACGGRVDVVYTYGSPPSNLVLRAIAVLAIELELADVDSGECRLPTRVTSVNRQGVSWTMIDPMDFIEKGRTGITEVDMAIYAARPSRARARIFSTEYPPPERLYAKLAGGSAETYTLPIVQGARLRSGFRWKLAGVAQSLVGYSWLSQVRVAEDRDSALIIDLTPYITLDPDGVTLRLDVPASVTSGITAVGSPSWDLFIWPTATPDDAFPLVQGRVTVDPATSGG